MACQWHAYRVRWGLNWSADAWCEPLLQQLEALAHLCHALLRRSLPLFGLGLLVLDMVQHPLHLDEAFCHGVQSLSGLGDCILDQLYEVLVPRAVAFLERVLALICPLSCLVEG